MAEDDRNIPEQGPAERPARAKAAVRHRPEEGASRRPSAASVANRPSAAGRRRSRRRPAKPIPAVGGAAAEVETEQSKELHVKIEAPAPAPSSDAGQAAGNPAAKSAEKPAAKVTAEPAGKSAEKPVVKSAEQPAARPTAKSGGQSAGRPAKATPDAAAGSRAEAASAKARNVRYSDAHPEGAGISRRRTRSTRPRGDDRDRARSRQLDATSVDPPASRTADLLRRQHEQLRQADWHTDDDNPYLQDGVEGPQDEHWFEDEEVAPLVPVRDITPQRRRRTASGTRFRALIAVLGVFAAMAALTLFVWITRSVEFTLNGVDTSTTYGTTLADYIRDNGLTFTPGNLISVSGNVLQEGAGDAYAATVDGEAKRPQDAAELRLTGGEVVELGNGLDVMEDHDTQIVKALPKLEFDGDVGAFSYVSQWGVEGTQEQLTGKVSGEVALGKYLEAPVNAVVTRLSIVPADNRRLVALTFDDGPSSYTPQYLDILEQFGVKATFFMFGPSAEANPEMARRVAEAGHQVCNHTSQHQDLSDLDAEQLQNELRTTFEQVDSAAGVQTTVLRPPWSIFDHDCWLKSGGLASASVIYTADSRDWDHPGVNSIVSYALEGTAPGSIILMHDGGYNGLSQDLEALPIIIGWLQDHGFELVTLSELLASDPAISEAAASCDDPMPEGCTWPTEFAETAEDAQ